VRLGRCAILQVGRRTWVEASLYTGKAAQMGEWQQMGGLVESCDDASVYGVMMVVEKLFYG
jgi:hypothetical protein